MPITTRDVAELIQTRLGFVPEESLVLACLTPEPAGDGLVVRIDLAALLPPGDPDALLECVGAPLRLARARAVVVAYYTQQPPTVITSVDNAVDNLLRQVPVPREATVLVDRTPAGPRRQDLGAITPADPADRAAALRALHLGDGDLHTYLGALACVARGRSVDAATSGRIAAWMARPAHRDAVIALCAVCNHPRTASSQAATTPTRPSGR